MSNFLPSPGELDRRFEGIKRLYGDRGFHRIASAEVMVVGLGGVGSWSVEALVRSGVGHLYLVDMDEICISNINRQIHALPTTIGKSKAEVLSERIRGINPNCKVTVIPKFFTESTAEQILTHKPTLVIDAIDRVSNKAYLIAQCREQGIPMVTTGSAGDRSDPTRIQVADLSHTIHDPLLSYVRKILRSKYGFPRHERKRFKIPCVYVPRQKNSGYQKPVDAPVCSTEARTCNDGMGTVAFVTGAVGFFAASEAVKIIVKG